MIVTKPLRKELFAQLIDTLEIDKENKEYAWKLKTLFWKLNREGMMFLINKANELREREPMPKTVNEGLNMFHEVK